MAAHSSHDKDYLLLLSAGNGSMKLFHFYRIEDRTGVSGTGPVVEGVQFSNGWCTLRWMSKRSSVAFYQSLEDVKAIHGHDGRTEIIVHDFEALERRPSPAQEANIDIFMQVIEETSRTLNMAEDSSFDAGDVHDSIEKIKRQLDELGGEIIKRKLRRAA